MKNLILLVAMVISGFTLFYEADKAELKYVKLNTATTGVQHEINN